MVDRSKNDPAAYSGAERQSTYTRGPEKTVTGAYSKDDVVLVPLGSANKAMSRKGFKPPAQTEN